MSDERDTRDQFGWSNSRRRLFEECPRAFYFRYYGAREGWSPTAPPLARALYILRHVKGRHVWAGAVVHETVEDLLRRQLRGDPGFLGAEWIVHDMLTGRMRPQWKASRDGLYLEEPKKYPGLLEHHYGYFVRKEEWKKLAEGAKKAVKNFLLSDFWLNAQRLPVKDWLLLEDLQSFRLDDVTIWIRCDFAYRDPDGRVVIVDWKTGRRPPKPRSSQLGCYGLFAVERWNLKPSDVRVVEMNLTRGRWAEAEISEEDLDRTREEIRRSIGEIRDLLIDPRNNRARAEDFAPAANRVSCSRCPYLEACADGQETVPLHGGGRLRELMAQIR